MGGAGLSTLAHVGHGDVHWPLGSLSDLQPLCLSEMNDLLFSSGCVLYHCGSDERTLCTFSASAAAWISAGEWVGLLCITSLVMDTLKRPGCWLTALTWSPRKWCTSVECRMWGPIMIQVVSS